MTSVTPEMNAALRATFEELADRFARLRAQADEVRREVRDLQGRASDGGITVTTSATGRLTNLEIEARAYRRLSPSELATAVMGLADRATKDAHSRVAVLLKPMLPPGADIEGILDGSADTSALAGEGLIGWEPGDPPAAHRGS